jgi:26S proteasome regulatory subunit N6
MHADPCAPTHSGTLLEQNLVRLIEPFSRVEIAHIASLIELPLAQVEQKLSQVRTAGGGRAGPKHQWWLCPGLQHQPPLPCPHHPHNTPHTHTHTRTRTCAQMILDKKFAGTLDQGAGCLEVFASEAPQVVFDDTLAIMDNLGGVVDTLFNRSQNVLASA